MEPGRFAARVCSVGEQARRVSNLGHILDVLSDRLTKSTQAGIFARKGEWRSCEPYNLADCMSRLQAMPHRDEAGSLLVRAGCVARRNGGVDSRQRGFRITGRHVDEGDRPLQVQFEPRIRRIDERGEATAQEGPRVVVPSLLQQLVLQPRERVIVAHRLRQRLSRHPRVRGAERGGIGVRGLEVFLRRVQQIGSP